MISNSENSQVLGQNITTKLSEEGLQIILINHNSQCLIKSLNEVDHAIIMV